MYNIIYHIKIGISSVKTIYRINPIFNYFGENADTKEKTLAIQQKIEELIIEQKKLKDFWKKAIKLNKEKSVFYKIKNKVILNTKNIKQFQLKRKLFNRFIELFKIIGIKQNR